MRQFVFCFAFVFSMGLGFFYGVAACMIWGFVYLVPEVLPGYPPALMAAGRFVSFGLVALPLAWMERREFSRYTLRDWFIVAKLGVVGNIIYYWCLIECIQNAGVPVAGMAMSAVPVLVAAVSNCRDRKKGTALSWSRLIPGLLLIVCGFALASSGEFEMIVRASSDGGLRFWYGVAMAAAALLIWTWYPIRNADWLLAHPERSPRAWSTAQGLATFPFALCMYLGFWKMEPAGTPLLGNDPLWFATVMVVTGLMGSWLGIVLWNAMSQRLPTALAGQMIVFETIFAVLYAHVLRMAWPQWNMLAGMALLLAGVLLSLKVFHAARRQSRGI